jgi:chromosomal replication initiation ATPase DnaA
MKVLAKLRLQVNAANYATWLSNTRGLICREGIFMLKVPNEFVGQYLGGNLRSLIEKTIIDVTGEEWRVGFQVGNGEL